MKKMKKNLDKLKITSRLITVNKIWYFLSIFFLLSKGLIDFYLHPYIFRKNWITLYIVLFLAFTYIIFFHVIKYSLRFPDDHFTVLLWAVTFFICAILMSILVHMQIFGCLSNYFLRINSYGKNGWILKNFSCPVFQLP
jgi:hypothetical protein